MLSQTDPDGNQTVWTYDNLNRVSSETECAGTSSQATASYVYGTNQQVCTQEAYDSADDMTSQTNELQDVTSYTYDDLGRVLTETEPVPASGGTAPTLTYSRRRPNSSLKPGVLMLIYTHVHTRWFKALLCFSEGQ
jgi:YD repeat-containing protein